MARLILGKIISYSYEPTKVITDFGVNRSLALVDVAFARLLLRSVVYVVNRLDLIETPDIGKVITDSVMLMATSTIFFAVSSLYADSI